MSTKNMKSTRVLRAVPLIFMQYLKLKKVVAESPEGGEERSVTLSVHTNEICTDLPTPAPIWSKKLGLGGNNVKLLSFRFNSDMKRWVLTSSFYLLIDTERYNTIRINLTH
ncbi:hypothetical protein AVEN_12993-1 [Araneus ventricosus]|uniref:Uncharacterized protein n=1 Tax=Araneus ventricosus TaxID=182803 RepID=A0A4Y2B7C4_ARAVE|nr:hypothetical protein AVEN_12993-1 [Araneus ventricosus]